MAEPSKKRARTENATREAIKRTEKYNEKVDAFSEKVRLGLHLSSSAC